MGFIPVSDLTVNDDGRMTWKTASQGDSQQAPVDDTVFILPPKDGSGYIVCCLSESTDTPDKPFQPRFLESEHVPDALLRKFLLEAFPDHLHHGNGAEVDIIVSTKSGTELSLGFWEQVLQPLWRLAKKHTGATITTTSKATSSSPQEDVVGDIGSVLLTQSEQSVREFSRKLRGETASREGLQKGTIVLLSGDGAVVDLLNGGDDQASPSSDGPQQPPTLALIPLGTGNALFHSLHRPIAASSNSPSPLVLALRTLFRGQPRALPAFQASFSPGSHIISFKPKNASSSSSSSSSADVQEQLVKQETMVTSLHGAIVASYGFHASIVSESDTPAYRVHGLKRFGMVAQELLRESHHYAATVEMRNNGASGFVTVPRKLHDYVTTTMVSNLERTFLISPAAQPLDGKLRTVHFGPVGGEKAMAIMMKAYDGGKHVGMQFDDEEGGVQKVGYDEIDEIRITTEEDDERWRKVCIDGTIVELPRGGTMSVMKAAEGSGFRVLVDPSILQG